MALTRAKQKLLLLGSASTLASSPPLARLLQHLHSTGATLQLPPDFLDGLENLP